MVRWLAKKERTRIECTCCGKKKVAGEYYRSQSDLYKALGFLPICKVCIDSFYNRYKKIYKDDKKTIYEFCRLFDLPYSEGSFNGAVQHSKKTGWRLYQSYFKQVNSLGDVNNAGTCFKDGETLAACSDTFDSDNFMDDIDISYNDIVDFWGSGFSKDEYLYLENFYNDFVNNYECDTPAQVLLFKNAAKTQLNADKALAKGNVNLYDKLIKTLSTILGDSNIKPVQETGANATEQATFGTLIKKWENEKPVPDALDDWKRMDWIKYIRIWFLSHLAKMVNIPNPYEAEYEEEMSRFRVNVSSSELNGDM